MSEGPMAKRTITKLREKLAIAEKRIIGSEQFVVAAPSPPGQVPVQSHESVTVPAEIEDAQIVAPEAKRGFALGLLAFRSVKSSPLLASFIGCVLVPAFAATIYFVFLASNQWAAEARFEVRQVDIDSRDTSLTNASQTNGQSGSTSQSAQQSVQSVTNFSFTATGQDAYIVTNYIASRAIVDDLSAMLNLREIFRRPEADFWARLKRNATIEELVDYWKSMVSTYIDAPSGIVTVQVRAFRTDDAVALAKAVLQLSEDLVNRISDRARHDAMETAEKEVRRTYEMTQAALADLHRFRDSAGIIDPMQTGTEVAKLLIPLMTEKIRLESDLFVASRNLDDSAPTIKALRSRLQSAEQQIADLRGRLTNTQGGNNTLAASIAKFEALELQRQFAEKLYTLAQADLDRARQRADRQSVYLTVFVPPSLPEESRYPRRVAFPILIFIGLTILWSIVVMTIASVEDHRL
jgi:capsular polysaccharide transport system permease protein